MAEYCAQHAPNGMVNLYKKKCRTESCSKRALFGVAGTKTDGRVNVTIIEESAKP